MSGQVWRIVGALLASLWVVTVALTGNPAGVGRWEPPVVAALIMVVAGVAAIGLGTGERRLGALTTAAGSLWLAAALAPELAGEVWPRALLAGATVLALPTTFLLVALATNDGRADLRARRLMLVLSCGAVVVTALMVVTWNPFYAPTTSCVIDCRDVPALIELDSSVRAWLRVLTTAFAVVVAVSLTGVALRSIGHHLGRVDHGRLLVAIGGLVVGGAGLAASLVAFGRVALPETRRLLSALAFGQLVQTVLALGVVLVSIGVVLVALRSALMRARVRRLESEVEAAPVPGTFAAVLGTALDDPSLEVAYADPETGFLVDASGDSTRLPATPDRTVTWIQRASRPIALVRHRPDLRAADITAELRPGLLFALDNERLRASRLAQLGALRESRSRIVEVAERERQRIERDLHDGAQQQLLAISIRLRLAREGVVHEGSVDLVDRLTSAELEARLAAEGLRKVARGIFPGVLARAGLVPALRSLSDESPLPFDVQGNLTSRLPWATEMAGYEIAARSLAVAIRCGATRMVVGVRQVATTLTMDIGGVEGSPSGAFEVVHDRVAAAGGAISIAATQAGGTLLRVELPCA